MDCKKINLAHDHFFPNNCIDPLQKKVKLLKVKKETKKNQ